MNRNAAPKAPFFSVVRGHRACREIDRPELLQTARPGRRTARCGIPIRTARNQHADEPDEIWVEPYRIGNFAGSPASLNERRDHRHSPSACPLRLQNPQHRPTLKRIDLLAFGPCSGFYRAHQSGNAKCLICLQSPTLPRSKPQRPKVPGDAWLL